MRTQGGRRIHKEDMCPKRFPNYHWKKVECNYIMGVHEVMEDPKVDRREENDRSGYIKVNLS
jgi:hypothetical protein